MTSDQIHELSEGIERVTSSTKNLALLFAVLAMFFALAETLSRSEQVSAQINQARAGDTWAYAHSKTSRMVSIQTAARTLETDIDAAPNTTVRDAKKKLIDELKSAYARYDSDPEQNDGRRQLVQRAETYERLSDFAMARFHHYSLASAMFQRGMWMAFVGLVIGIALFGFMAVALAIMGLFFVFVGQFAPFLFHVL
jgi:hypothetical protein